MNTEFVDKLSERNLCLSNAFTMSQCPQTDSKIEAHSQSKNFRSPKIFMFYALWLSVNLGIAIICVNTRNSLIII